MDLKSIKNSFSLAFCIGTLLLSGCTDKPLYHNPYPPHECVPGTCIHELKLLNTASGAFCYGPSEYVYSPYPDLLTCRGQRNIAHLHCTDGTQMIAEWTATSCNSGFGVAHDNCGHKLFFELGKHLGP